MHTDKSKQTKFKLLIIRYRRFCLECLFIVTITCAAIGIAIHYLQDTGIYKISSNRIPKKITPSDFVTLVEERLLPSTNNSLLLPQRSHCTHHTCLNVYRCGHGPSLRVYVYPPKRYLDKLGMPIASPISREYHLMLEAIINSRHYEPDPFKACIFVPAIDTLNQNRFSLLETSQALHSLPYWDKDGENHLIFNMIAGAPPRYNTVVELALGKAIVAGGGFDSWTYQSGFDVSIPVFSPIISFQYEKLNEESSRTWLLVSSQINLHAEYQMQLQALSNQDPSNILVLSSCGDSGNSTLRCQGDKIYQYPEIYQKALFCIVIRGARLGQPTLLEALSSGCIPVILADSIIMPFSEIIDWKRAAIFVPEGDLDTVLSRVKAVSDKHRLELRQQGHWLYLEHFCSIKHIVKTTLNIIEDRVFSYNARSYLQWNLPPIPNSVKPPLFLPLTAPKVHGFTAVVLTYNRIESLFQLLKKLSLIRSLAKILVIWNHQHKVPPPAGQWPELSKPVSIIRTKANKLSNRFYPYPDIETEAILTIDDDIVMLTADELEFGYAVWREFPDRIVGFPSRTHIWDNTTDHWRYEPEWKNHISLVLTGAAFHHKYWNYLYTTGMPGNIKEWVDEHMNCEDIAMNFLVANATQKAPIKVTPRKKFKCPECKNTEILSADINHMIERSQCINYFAAVYGAMPLKTVEFRADPVLYHDNFPEKLKQFNDIGSL